MSEQKHKKVAKTVLPESIWIKMARTNVLGFAAVNINLLEKLHFYSHNKMALESLGLFLLDCRSSICMIMNVMFTPATANGYSHVALLPHCFFSSLWNEACGNKIRWFLTGKGAHQIKKSYRYILLTENVLAKNRRFSREMNPAPL